MDRAPRSRRGYMRGSGVLLGGRLIAIGLNFVVQVLLVRALSKGDYGAFGFALAVVTVLANVNLLGLTRALGRFAPMYEEQGELVRMAGTIMTALVIVAGFGAAIVSFVLAFGPGLADRVGTDPLSIQILLLMIALGPVQAFDSLGQTLAAAFLGARAIFFRRHLLGPLLRLIVVGAVLLLGGTVRDIAVGYVVAGVIGVFAYAWMLIGLFRRHPAASSFRLANARPEAGSLLRFATPLLTTDLALVLRVNLAVIVLEAARGPEEVASLRAVIPVAGLLLIVFQSFKLMFLPVVSRLFARKARPELADVADGEIADLYWKTVCWLAILAFPALAVFTLLPEQITVMLFEARYASSAALLAVLALAQFPHAVFGLSAQVLQAYARLKRIVINNLAAIGVLVAANLLFAPRYGAIGSAWAIVVGIVVHVGLNQWAASRQMGTALVRRDVFVILMEVGVLLGALLGLRAAGFLAPITAIVLIAAGTLLLLRVNRRALDVDGTFPELRKIPGFGRLVGGSP